MTTVVTQKEYFMTSPRVIYFGISTQKSAAEVGGWSKVEQMGLKDALTYDTTTQKYHNYTKSEITNLINHLQTADLIVGFNQLQFEYKILSSYTDTNLNALPNFDMLSKIEGALNFRVSRDNLAQNTLGEFKHNKRQSSLGKRIDTTKKLFAHGCKEGHLSYQNDYFGTKAVCDTSNWADTARSMTERKQLFDTVGKLNKPGLSPPSAVSRRPRKPSIQEPTPKPTPSHLVRTGRSVTPKEKLTPKLTLTAPQTQRLSSKIYHLPEYHWSKSPTSSEFIGGNSIHTRIPGKVLEQAVQIYDAAKRQHRHNPAFYAYDEMMEANLLDPAIPFHQFNVAIAGLWLDRNPHKSGYKNGNSRFYFIDGSGTLVSERVRDYIDMRNIREESARG